MFTKRNGNGGQQNQQQLNGAPCTMEPMEDRLLMASDYLRPTGSEPTTAPGTTITFTYKVTTSAPTSGILIGLLLPAVQQAR